MKLVTIDYVEFKRLVGQEIRLKVRIAELEDEIEGLEYDNHRLKMELFEERNQLIEEDELLDD
ncbi:hypothetical protein G5I91_001974 [Staphylococcus pseudintermedius]|uniref:hypothetical protein n=1 Tax=Staphylococcus pseudintermedius TaxID=283734 RepID=UPI0019314A23|nr:hypothetical protein [Staphylococcus pseudintermedius]EGQ3294303.1 hypothetical protein [Staphylococcus pseudintermedius]EGQ3419331.1 hypothetical protein [Staphylococcus pseudintermedius]EGQ3835945.1 hypothetical protein [Staphylococcus pseudintermedius]EGQ4134040.1 hypothetical protein [Staphylococcus pseudintermedius]EGQ4284723.1 hypothetical protein [Staphylococcus pseudintermedius]